MAHGDGDGSGIAGGVHQSARLSRCGTRWATDRTGRMRRGSIIGATRHCPCSNGCITAIVARNRASAADPVRCKGLDRMSVDEDVTGPFVQRFSLWKISVVILLVTTGAILPLTRGFSNGLVYTGFFYKVPFLVLGCCIVLGLISLASLPMLWWAIVRAPALVISEGTISVRGLRERVGNVADVTRVVSIWPGANLNVEFRNRRPMAVPLFLYEQPLATKQKLQLMAGPAN
jgi:hypothetical protein